MNGQLFDDQILLKTKHGVCFFFRFLTEAELDDLAPDVFEGLEGLYNL